MPRQAALDRAAAHFESGIFLAELAALVAVPTESQEPSAAPHRRPRRRELRPRGRPAEPGHHSGNWGGLLANPAILLAHAIATIVSDKGVED